MNSPLIVQLLGNIFSEDPQARSSALSELAAGLAQGDPEAISRFGALLLAAEHIGVDWKEKLIAEGWSIEDAYEFVHSYEGAVTIAPDGKIDDASFSGPYAEPELLVKARRDVPEIPRPAELRSTMLLEARACRAIAELCKSSPVAAAAGLAAVVTRRSDLDSIAKEVVSEHFARVWVPLISRSDAGDERIARLSLVPLPPAEAFESEDHRFYCAALLAHRASIHLREGSMGIRVAAIDALGSLFEEDLIPDLDLEKILDRLEQRARVDRTPKVRRRAVAALLGEHEWHAVPASISPARRAAFLSRALEDEHSPSVRLFLATGLFLLAQANTPESADAAAKLTALAVSDAELPVVNRRALELKAALESPTAAI